MKFCISKNEKGTILYDSHKLKINKNYDNFTVIDLYKIVKSSHLIKVIPKLLKSVLKQTKLIYKEFKQIFGVFSRFYVIFIYVDTAHQYMFERRLLTCSLLVFNFNRKISFHYLQ